MPKLLWLHDNLTEGKEEYSEEEAHALIELYLERYREEMDELESQVRKNRPKPSRLTLLNAMHDSEKQSYELGSFGTCPLNCLIYPDIFVCRDA